MEPPGNAPHESGVGVLERDGDPWWLRLGIEEPMPEEGCPEHGCSSESIDLFCDEHETYLPQNGEELDNSHRGVIVVSGVIVYIAFWTAAAYNAAAPLFAIFALAGAVLLGEVLRRLPLARTTAQVLWVMGIAAALAFIWLVPSPKRWLVTVILVATLTVWLTYTVAQIARHPAVVAEGMGLKGCATLLGVVAAGGLTVAAETALPPYLAWPTVRVWAGGIGLGAFAAWLLMAVVTGAGRAAATVDTTVVPLIPKPRGAQRVQFRRPPAHARTRGRRDFLQLMADVVAAFASRVARATVTLAETAINVALHSLKIALSALVALLNQLWTYGAVFIRYLISVYISTVRLVRDSIVRAAASGWHSGRITLLPIAAAVAGAAALLSAAEMDREYLSSGAPAAAGGLILSIAGAAVALAVLWSAWSGMSLPHAALSSARSLKMLAGYGLVCLAIGGWLLGLPGTLGHGPIHVGWFTVAATVVFVAALARSRYAKQGKLSELNTEWLRRPGIRE